MIITLIWLIGSVHASEDITTTTLSTAIPKAFHRHRCKKDLKDMCCSVYDTWVPCTATFAFTATIPDQRTAFPKLAARQDCGHLCRFGTFGCVFCFANGNPTSFTPALARETGAPRHSCRTTTC